MSKWVKVAERDSFFHSRRVEIRGHPIALFKLKDNVYALDDICSHEYSRLSEGEIWDGEVFCPKHGSRFNIKTGEVRGLPATKPVKSYPIRIENGVVYIQWK